MWTAAEAAAAFLKKNGTKPKRKAFHWSHSPCIFLSWCSFYMFLILMKIRNWVSLLWKANKFKYMHKVCVKSGTKMQPLRKFEEEDNIDRNLLAFKPQQQSTFATIAFRSDSFAWIWFPHKSLFLIRRKIHHLKRMSVCCITVDLTGFHFERKTFHYGFCSDNWNSWASMFWFALLFLCVPAINPYCLVSLTSIMFCWISTINCCLYSFLVGVFLFLLLIVHRKWQVKVV